MNPKTQFTDTERLEWLINSERTIRCMGFGYGMQTWFVLGNNMQAKESFFKTAREAIDDAMRREGK